MSLDVKVVPDTNVVVAASIIKNTDIMGTIKHHFYDQSIQLFSLFRNSDIGFAMPQVRSECYAVLSKAVKLTYIPKGDMDMALKEKFYDEFASFITSSEYKMRALLSRLTIVKPTSRDVSENLNDVIQMSKHLRSMYRATCGSASWRMQEIQKRSKPVLTEPAWSKEQKKEAVYIHRVQVKKEAKQLERFMRKYPNKPRLDDPR